MKSIQMIFFIGLLFKSSLNFAAVSNSSSTQKLVTSTPFITEFNITTVQKALQTSPLQLVKYIEQQGVKVYKIPRSTVTNLKANPIFAKTKLLPKVRYSACDLELVSDNSEEGQFFQEGLDLCDFKENWIAISDTSSGLTLIHEYIHYLFSLHETPEDHLLGQNLSSQIEKTHRSLMKNFNSLSFQIELLKRDGIFINFINQIYDFNTAFKNGIRLSLSEEVVIERILAILASKSLHYNDPVRLEKGQLYIQSTLIALVALMNDLNEVIDLVNQLNESDIYPAHAGQLEGIKKNLNSISQEINRYYQSINEYQPSLRIL